MSSKRVYRLINPFIEGSINKEIPAKNSFVAADRAYKTMTKYFTNPIEHMNIAVQNMKTGNIYHYLITEKKGTDGNMDYTMTLINQGIPEDISKTLLELVNKEDKIFGGKGKEEVYDDDDNDSRDDDMDVYEDDDSDSDDDDYVRVRQSVPIFKYIYYPLAVEYLNISGLSINDYHLFVPRYVPGILPLTEIRLDLYRI